MELEEFVEKVRDIEGVCLVAEYEAKAGWNTPKFSYTYGRKTDIIEPEKAAILVEWTSGGVTGGSCWGGVADSAVQPEDPKELTDLDKILEAFWPDMSFLQYRRLANEELIKQDTVTRNEYYGNHYIYTRRYAYLKDIWKVLRDNNRL